MTTATNPKRKTTARMGRRRQPPPPRRPGDPWQRGLARLVTSYQNRMGDDAPSDRAIAEAAGVDPTKFSRALSAGGDLRVSELLAILAEIKSDLCKLHRA